MMDDDPAVAAREIIAADENPNFRGAGNVDDLEDAWDKLERAGVCAGPIVARAYLKAADEIDRLRKVLFYLVEYLAEADEEGLIEHAEPMILARKVLGRGVRYVCTHGHDRCFQMSAGPECPTCERRPAEQSSHTS